MVLPYTIRRFATRYRTALRLYQVMYVMYFLDIWRRHSHPHSWILNTPVFAAWLADLAIGRLWRRSDADVERVWLSKDYAVLYWRHCDGFRGAFSRGVCVNPLYFVKLVSQALLDRAHPFSTFGNHAAVEAPPADIADPAWRGHVFVVETDATGCETLVANSSAVAPRDIREEGGQLRPWDVAVVMRVYCGKCSHTATMADSQGALITWGPFRNKNVVHYALHRTPNPLVLVVGGSSASYLLDYFSQFADRGDVVLAFTTGDVGLIQYVCWYLEHAPQAIVGRGQKPLRAVTALTAPSVQSVRGDAVFAGGAATLRLGRLDLDELCADLPGADVFAIGSAGL